VEAAIRAVVGVAKSTPAPPGLKAALTRDCDFLTLLGRKPKDANAPVSAGTTGGADAARAADEAFLSLEGERSRERRRRSGRRPSVTAWYRSTISGDRRLWRPLFTRTRLRKRRNEGGVRDERRERESEEDRRRRETSDERFARRWIGDDRSRRRRDDFRRDDVSSDDSYFRPAPELDDFEWADSRDGLRRRPSREDDGSNSTRAATW
jgi:hypothetical protein